MKPLDPAALKAALDRPLDQLHELIDFPRTEAWTTFVSSTKLDFDAWHDGTGYNLTALGRMPEAEQDLIRQWLRARLGGKHHAIDWRELDAAAALGETALLRSLTEHPSDSVRLRAKNLVAEPGEVAEQISRTLSGSGSEGSVSQALDHVAANPTDEVRKALVSRVARLDANFINAAMVMLEVFCDVEDSWSERPFLFRVQEEGPNGPLMRELLARASSLENEASTRDTTAAGR